VDLLKRTIILLCLVISLILSGVLLYVIVEGFTPLDALWLTIVSLTTVGYGDVVPQTVAGRLLTLLLIMGGVSFLTYVLGTIVGIFVEGKLTDIVGRQRMEKKINTLNNHIIVCGAGRIGKQVIQRLIKENVPFVVIDLSEERLMALTEENDVYVVRGNATEDETLLRAGIHRATGLVATLPEDSENVFVTLTAKGMNSQIRVVARANQDSSVQKLQRAGAEKVISPAVIGGRRMAISILKPASVEFIETLMYESGLEFEIEELSIDHNSDLDGRSLRDSRIKQESGAMVIAIKRNQEIIHNPTPGTIINGGDLLIALGTRNQLKLLERLTTNDKV